MLVDCRREYLKIGLKVFSEVRTGAMELSDLCVPRTEGYGGKLFHREDRGALERDIIDTSWQTYSSHRCLISLHFGALLNTNVRRELAVW